MPKSGQLAYTPTPETLDPVAPHKKFEPTSFQQVLILK